MIVEPFDVRLQPAIGFPKQQRPIDWQVELKMIAVPDSDSRFSGGERSLQNRKISGGEAPAIHERLARTACERRLVTGPERVERCSVPERTRAGWRGLELVAESDSKRRLEIEAASRLAIEREIERERGVAFQDQIAAMQLCRGSDGSRRFEVAVLRLPGALPCDIRPVDSQR